MTHTMTETHDHYTRVLDALRATHGACIDSAAAECELEGVANNGPPCPHMLCELVFPRARAHMSTLDIDTLPGMERIDSAEDFGQAELALAHSSRMAGAIALGCGLDFGEEELDASGLAPTLSGPHARWAIGADGRGYLAVVEESTDGGCYTIAWYRTVLVDAPSYLDALTRRRTTVVRRGRLVRSVDVTGVSGTGHVADLEQLADGRVVVAWRGETPTVTVHASWSSVERVHLHGGASRVGWGP